MNAEGSDHESRGSRPLKPKVETIGAEGPDPQLFLTHPSPFIPVHPKAEVAFATVLSSLTNRSGFNA